MSVVVLNYSHPLTEAQSAHVRDALGEAPVVRELAMQIDRTVPLATVAVQLADAAGLDPAAWQTTPLIVNPPALAPVALSLIAELHGRMGGFPTILNMRPVPDSVPTRYEIGDIVNLQALRDVARGRR